MSEEICPHCNDPECSDDFGCAKRGKPTNPLAKPENTEEQRKALTGSMFANMKPLDSRPRRFGWCEGEYFVPCRKCGCQFQGDKRAYHCADCAYAMPDEAKPEEIPTPRTDAAEMNTMVPHHVSSILARSLERELAEAKATAGEYILKDHQHSAALEKAMVALETLSNRTFCDCGTEHYNNHRDYCGTSIATKALSQINQLKV